MPSRLHKQRTNAQLMQGAHARPIIVLIIGIAAVCDSLDAARMRRFDDARKARPLAPIAPVGIIAHDTLVLKRIKGNRHNRQTLKRGIRLHRQLARRLTLRR